MTDPVSREQVARCGFVALVGRPNVGKSTLLNCLLDSKISITSAKAQTTRQRVIGVLSEEQCQFIFVDTPGFQTRHRSALNAKMNQAVREALAEVDIVLILFEGKTLNEADEIILRLLPSDKTVIGVVNKIDLLSDKTQLLPFLDGLSKRFSFAALVPVSSSKGWQLDHLKKEIARHLPEGPWLYGAEDITDRDERFLAAEFIREKVFRLTGDEVPYATHVVVERFVQEGHLRRIDARIYVERDSQRVILLGHQGQTLKRIATEARQDMERLFGGKVFLTVHIQIRQGWMDDARTLRQFDF